MSQIRVPILWALVPIEMRGNFFNLIWSVAKVARDTECPEFSISSFSSSCLHWVNLRLKLGWVMLHTRWWFALERPALSGRSGSIPYYTRLEYKRDCPWFNAILLLDSKWRLCLSLSFLLTYWKNDVTLKAIGGPSLGSYHVNVWVS